MLEADGWKLVRITGSNHHFKPLDKPGLVTVAHPQERREDPSLAKHRAPKRPEVAERLSMAIRHYPAIIEGDANTGYSVFFPDLPGCTSGGKTLQAAALNAEQALAGHVDLMLQAGEALPEPSILDRLPRPVEPDVVEAARLLVRIQVREAAPA
jgi:predicted RNase H-like HicB family nuclease